MKITDVKYNWSGTLTKRSSTKYIILHHRAGNGDVQSIHRIHLSNGWSGIGYHFYVRKDGSIYTGRPIDTVGAHCTGFNSQSVGVCFEGDYEKESTMPQTQVSAGAELISYLMQLYPGAEIKAHRDFMATSCPGKNFPFEKIKSWIKDIPDQGFEQVIGRTKLQQELLLSGQTQISLVFEFVEIVQESHKAKA